MFEQTLYVLLIIAFIALALHIGRIWYDTKIFPITICICTFISCAVIIACVVGVHTYTKSDIISSSFALCCILITLLSVGLQIADFSIL